MSDSSNRLYWLVFAAVLVVLCLPVLLTTYPALVDYPNHLARAYILHNYHNVAVYRQDYVVSERVLPNLAIDVLVPPLLRLMDWPAASRVFLCLTVVSFALGCHWLGTAIHGHPTWMAVLCSFFVYNSMLLYGFVNYLFGLGCFCWALAYWLQRRHRWTPRQLAIAAIFTFFAYVAHLGAYSFLAAAYVTITAWDVWKRQESMRNVALSLLPLVPEVVLYAARTVERGGPGHVEWNSVSGKLIALLPLFLTYDRRFDAVFLILLAVICGIGLVAGAKSKVVWPIFLAGIALVILLAVCPKVMLTSSGADARFFPPAALLLVLSVSVAMRPRTAVILFTACLMLFSVRVGAIWADWRQLDRAVGEQVDFFSILPEGARVYSAFPPANVVQLPKRERSLEHVISLATITRHAFVFSQFANPAQQPVQFRKPPVYVPPDGPPERWLPSVEDAEYVWSYRASKPIETALAGRCVPVGERNGFTIWKVRR